jgi:hypothetical protein
VWNTPSIAQCGPDCADPTPGKPGQDRDGLNVIRSVLRKRDRGDKHVPVPDDAGRVSRAGRVFQEQ